MENRIEIHLDRKLDKAKYCDFLLSKWIEWDGDLKIFIPYFSDGEIETILPGFVKLANKNDL